MTRFTPQAFEKAFSTPRAPTAEFLLDFRDRGCYVDDISHVPVDRLDPCERKRTLEESVAGFAARLIDLRPQVIVGVLMSIEKPLREAVRLSGLDVPVHMLPFPGHGHQRRYVDGLAEILVSHLEG